MSVENYDELKELIFTKQSMKLPIIYEVNTFEKKIAKILKTQKKRVMLDVKKDSIVIDITRNRDVCITSAMMEQLLTLFNAESFVISSPIRCKLVIKLERE